MAESEDLQNILKEIVQNVASRGDSRAAVRAFDAYRRCLEPLVAPYIRDGFFDEHRALARFFSETATLHLAVSLIPPWCAAHDGGRTDGFCDIYPEAGFFSWYKVPKALSLKIKDWVTAHSDIGDVLQAVALVAENSLAGLRQRALGEFFTPTEIVQHLVALANYDPLEISTHKIVDPACGSGNLLAAVVAKTVQAVRSGSLDPTVAISGMNRNVYGFDVQPIAILLTRLQLLLAGLPILKRTGLTDTNVYETLSFPHVQLRDPLSNPEDLWDLFAPFDTVLGNPPFLKVAKDRLPFVGKYEEILAGHINLYQLFLWWAIRATRSGGRVVFLIPQSIRSGQYPGKLRQEITNTCEMTAITGFADRTGVFDSVEQPMMIVALRKLTPGSQKSNVDVRISANGQSLEHSPALNVGQEQVVRMQDSTPIWCVSNERLDYDVLARVCERQTVLGEAEEFKILNGGFVWNQHKERLKSVEGENTLPLLSSASIGVHQFTFPPFDKRVSQRLFVDATPPLPGPVHTSATILLKRTTPKIVRGRRIVAAMLPNDFLTKYLAYFAENHVNIILPKQSSTPNYHLLGLCAWLNSRLANFVFGMMNMSSHLSKFDLEIIPTPMSFLAELGDLASTLVASPTEERREILDRIDAHIYGSLGLSAEESQRVSQITPPAM